MPVVARLVLVCSLLFVSACTVASLPRFPGAGATAGRPGQEVKSGQLARAGLLLDEAVAEATAGGQLGAERLASLRFVVRARDLMTREQNEEALDLLERSMGLDGGSWYTWLYMAEAWRRGGDPARGRVYLEKLDGRVPDDERLALEIELLRRQVYLPAGLTGEFSGRDG
ncbi:MAG: hypothetical protein H8E45_00770 [Proteobacteria bacterium]|nr:hypothetical protein [Pseudomonadota bacterium]